MPINFIISELAKIKKKIPTPLIFDHIQEMEAYIDKKNAEIKVLKKLLIKINESQNDKSKV